MYPPLSSDDYARLAHVQRGVLTPGDHASPEAWMQHVLGMLLELFEAERGVGTIGAEAEAALVSLGVAPRALLSYASDFATDDSAGDIVSSSTRPYYVEEDFEGIEAFRLHKESAVYNEWYRPHGLTESIGMFVLGSPAFVPDLYAVHEAPIVANILLSGTKASSGEDAERARLFLSLLQPSLAASVRTWQRMSGVLQRFEEVIDRVGAAAWLFDRDGVLLHRKDRAGVALSPDERETLQAYASALCASERARHPTPSAPVETLMGHPLRVVRLQASSPRTPALLLWLDEPTPLLLDEEALRAQFNLTPQQTRVALFLAQRRSTSAIADALCISPHTVRRHVEQVLSKLGVTRRTEIGAKLSSAMAEVRPESRASENRR